MAKVLVIEDELAIITLLKRMLASAGHELTTASDGPAAVASARSGSYDVILTDLTMPSAPSGMELIRQIRELHPNTPIVVVSGYAAADIVDQCRTYGITEFLPKPFELMQVRTLVARLAARTSSAA